MTDYRNEEINPEDHWPEAEQLLDQHFQKKKKRRVLYLLLLLLLVGAGGISVWKSANNKNTASQNSSTTTIESVGASASTINQETTSTNNSTIRTPENNPNQLTTEEKVEKKLIPVKNTSEDKNHLTHKKNIPVTVTVISQSEQIKIPKQNSNSYHKEASTINSNDLSSSLSQNTTGSAAINPDSKYSSGDITFAPSLSLLPTQNTIATPEIASPAVKKYKKSRLDIIAYLGAGSVKKNIYTPSSTIDLTRREQEEESVILPYGGFQVSYEKGRWAFRAGLELNIQGEKVNYSPYSIGKYDSTYYAWDYYQTSITDVDSTYIMGILFKNTHIVIINDSAYNSKTDTLNGNHFDPSISQANGTNKIYFVEIPFEVAYTKAINRWGIGISVGLSPGYMIAANGNYLTPDQSGYQQASVNSFNRFILSGRAGLEFSYLASSKIKILLRPGARINLTPIKDDSGAAYKYQSFGMNAGISYSIR